MWGVGVGVGLRVRLLLVTRLCNLSPIFDSTVRDLPNMCGTLVSQCLWDMCWESLFDVVPPNVSQHGSHVWSWFVAQPVDHDIHDQYGDWPGTIPTPHQ